VNEQISKYYLKESKSDAIHFILNICMPANLKSIYAFDFLYIEL